MAHITLTVDIVLLHQQQVLLIQRRKPPFQDSWALPGGKVNYGEDLEAAARRELVEETGIQGQDIKLSQIHTYGRSDRDPRGHFVSVAYVGHLTTEIPPLAGDDAKAAAWFPLVALPPMAFDHSTIVFQALKHEGIGEREQGDG